MSTELSGSQVNYYLISVNHPMRKDQVAYTAECEDIIRALGMTFAEGEEFKAIWRTAAARQGLSKGTGQEQLDNAIYNAEKRVHFAQGDLDHYKHEKRDQKLRDKAPWKPLNPATTGSYLDPHKWVKGTWLLKEEWYEWHGGEMPVDPATTIVAALRSGSRLDGTPSGAIRWNHAGTQGDVVKFKVVS